VDQQEVTCDLTGRVSGKELKLSGALVFSGMNIEFSFRAPDTGRDLALATEVRREVLLIFKEAVNNLAKYADASAADIDLYSDKNVIHLIVKDNGKGFDAAGITNSNGLRNMQMRAASHKGSVSITSNPHEGTSIHATFAIA